MPWTKVPTPSKDAVIAALEEFDARHRDLPDWANWAASKAHRFSVQHDGKLYPSKMVLQLASGIDRSEFSGGMAKGQAGAILRDAGFVVVDLRAVEVEVEEHQQPNHWALLAIPSRYRIRDAIEAGLLDRWTTAGKAIRKGDRVVIWQGRDQAGRRGVVALGQVVTDPETTGDEGNGFWADPAEAAEVKERVAVRYLRLREPLWLGGPQDQLLRRLSVSRATGGTVFHVTPEQWGDLIGFLADDQPTEVPRPTTATEEVRNRAGRGQGYGLTAEQRKSVELHAMALAKAHFEREGYRVEDVSAIKPYDLICWKDGVEHHVEVKGTTGDGSHVMITNNEFTHSTTHYSMLSLFIVSNVRLDGRNAHGGAKFIITPFDASLLDPTPVSFSIDLRKAQSPKEGF